MGRVTASPSTNIPSRPWLVLEPVVSRTRRASSRVAPARGAHRACRQRHAVALHSLSLQVGWEGVVAVVALRLAMEPSGFMPPSRGLGVGCFQRPVSVPTEDSADARVKTPKQLGRGVCEPLSPAARFGAIGMQDAFRPDLGSPLPASIRTWANTLRKKHQHCTAIGRLAHPPRRRRTPPLAALNAATCRSQQGLVLAGTNRDPSACTGDLASLW